MVERQQSQVGEGNCTTGQYIPTSVILRLKMRFFVVKHNCTSSVTSLSVWLWWSFCKWSHQKHKTVLFEAPWEAVLGTAGGEGGAQCCPMGRPELRETCILSVITSVRV